MSRQMIAGMGGLVLGFGLVGSADAASVVDITYDLSGTTFTRSLAVCNAVDGCVASQLLGGSMTVRYASNSASSIPIVQGPATLQSLTLQAHFSLRTAEDALAVSAASANIHLLSPVAESLLSGGTLALGGAQIGVTGSRHCTLGYGYCLSLASTLTSIVGPLGPYTTATTLHFAASPGPYGGAQSTRHIVTGRVPAFVPSKFIGEYPTISFATGADLFGREVLRQADGHDPKVTPEPGTLLLLGAGATASVLVGRATRRSRL